MDDHEGTLCSVHLCHSMLSLRTNYAQTFTFWVKAVSSMGFGITLIFWYRYRYGGVGLLEGLEVASIIIEFPLATVVIAALSQRPLFPDM